MKKIRARFIGQNGSLGYENGAFYGLETNTRPSEIFEDKRNVIFVQRLDGTGAVEYEHFEIGFLNNWDDIIHI